MGRIAYLESAAARHQNLCHNALAQLPVDIKQLKDCVKDQPGLAGVLDKARALYQPLAKRPEREHQHATAPANRANHQYFRANMAGIDGPTPIPCARRQRAGIRSAQNPLRHCLIAKDVISILILFTVASALIVIYRFGKTIARRIAVTSENTVRLSQGMALHAPVEGTDEIAQLDRAFHNMANELALAQQRRQRHLDDRSRHQNTLTSVYGSIEYLDSGYGGELNDKGAGMTERALRNLERVLAMISSMLMIEQPRSG